MKILNKNMKKVYDILKVVLYCVVGIFLGNSFYQYYDYKVNPDLYNIQSAQWYLGIQINSIFTIFIIILIFAIMSWIKKRIK